MRRRLLLAVVAAGLMAGCATNQITDFTDRSVGYGWLNIKDVQANRLHSVYIYQFRPLVPEPYYSAAVKEFKGGYLYWTLGLPNGAHKTLTASGQRCLGFLCGDTVYRYSFGKQGDEVGAVTIRNPGVYYLGSYDLKDIPTGFFEAGKFDAVPAKAAPSRREMLEEILKDAQDTPVMAERIRHELATLR